jgi:Dihydrodipicolinate reductase
MVILGICGKMGSQIYEKYKNEFSIVGLDMIRHADVETYENLEQIPNPIDVLVDFSSPDTYEILCQGIHRRIPILSGTTGYTFEQIEQLEQMAIENNTPFVWKANYAKGIKLFSKLIEDCKDEFEVLDFVEIHATSKKDAPSGTAKVLARRLNIPEQKIQSLRINQAPAIHEIIFSSEDERVFLRHEIINKKAFITGFDEELRKIFRS